jgi:hypothetical protein
VSLQEGKIHANKRPRCQPPPPPLSAPVQDPKSKVKQEKKKAVSKLPWWIIHRDVNRQTPPFRVTVTMARDHLILKKTRLAPSDLVFSETIMTASKSFHHGINS